MLLLNFYPKTGEFMVSQKHLTMENMTTFFRKEPSERDAQFWDSLLFASFQPCMNLTRQAALPFLSFSNISLYMHECKPSWRMQTGMLQRGITLPCALGADDPLLACCYHLSRELVYIQICRIQILPLASVTTILLQFRDQGCANRFPFLRHLSWSVKPAL